MISELRFLEMDYDTMCRCFLLITDTLVEVSCVQQLQLHDYLMLMIRSFVSGSSGVSYVGLSSHGSRLDIESVVL